MESVLRGLAIYAVLLLITRLSGRRTLAQITAFDFVLLLIIAETTQQALLGDDFSFTNAVVLIVTLFLTDVILSHAKRRWPGVARWLDGVPTVLMSGGRLDREALARCRIEVEDILEAARSQQGLKSLAEIDCAVLEVGGAISIIPREGAGG